MGVGVLKETFITRTYEYIGHTYIIISIFLRYYVVFPAHNHCNTFQKRVNRIPVERKANSRVGKARGFSGELFACTRSTAASPGGLPSQNPHCVLHSLQPTNVWHEATLPQINL